MDYDFFIGEQFEKTFDLSEIDENGNSTQVAISEVSGAVYETKNKKKILHRFEDDSAPTQIDEYHVKFTFTPEITSKFRPDIELSFDVWVGDIYRVFQGILGIPGISPAVPIVEEEPEPVV